MQTPDSETGELRMVSKRPPIPAALSRAAPRAPDPARSLRIARLAAQAGLDKKASDPRIIEIAGRVDYADYLVVMTGASDRNVAAIAHGVESDLAQRGVRAISVEGLPEARWVLIDLVDVVVHVFQEEARQEYDIDGLWLDAKRVDLAEPPAPAGKPLERLS